MAIYTVKSGDTLSAIATWFGTTVHELQQLNDPNIPDVNRIQIDQQIIVPDGGVQPQPPRGNKNPWEYFSPSLIASASGCNETDIEHNWPHVHWALDELGIADQLVQAGAIGTIAIETASTFRAIEEYRNRDGSIPDIWYTYDGGILYHGRGYIQLTHRYNYKTYGEKPNIRQDLVNHPELALDQSISAWVLAYFFLDNGVARAAQSRNWQQVRRCVLGPSDAGLPRLRQIVRDLGV